MKTEHFDNLFIMIIFLFVTFISGILGGLIYFQMNLLSSNLQEIDFVIPLAQNSTSGALNVTTFQDVLQLTVYPFLNLADSIPTLVYFMIFGFIIALILISYLSSKNPIFYIIHLLFTLLLTYFSIKIMNLYTYLLTNSFINSLMVDFSVYNFIMLHLPQIFFITSLLFASIAFINVIKPTTQDNPYGLSYGGDY